MAFVPTQKKPSKQASAAAKASDALMAMFPSLTATFAQGATATLTVAMPVIKCDNTAVFACTYPSAQEPEIPAPLWWAAGALRPAPRAARRTPGPCAARGSGLSARHPSLGALARARLPRCTRRGWSGSVAHLQPFLNSSSPTAAHLPPNAGLPIRSSTTGLSSLTAPPTSCASPPRASARVRAASRPSREGAPHRHVRAERPEAGHCSQLGPSWPAALLVPSLHAKSLAAPLALGLGREHTPYLSTVLCASLLSLDCARPTFACPRAAAQRRQAAGQVHEHIHGCCDGRPPAACWQAAVVQQGGVLLRMHSASPLRSTCMLACPLTWQACPPCITGGDGWGIRKPFPVCPRHPSQGPTLAPRAATRQRRVAVARACPNQAIARACPNQALVLCDRGPASMQHAGPHCPHDALGSTTTACCARYLIGGLGNGTGLP